MTHRTISIGKELLIVAAGYTLLAVFVTWPVVADLGGPVGGFDGRDSFQHVWLYWWFWEALLNQHQTPAYVTAMYFPLGASHPVLWVHALAPLFGLPLTGLVGPTATYNLSILLSIILTGLTAYLLCRDVIGQPQAAFIGGLVFAFAPTRLGHIIAGHQLLVFNFALPLYTLALWLWLKRPRWRLAALYAISLFLALISHPNFVGYFLLPVTLVLLAGHIWQHKGFSGQPWPQLLLGWLAAGVLFLPFAGPMIADLTGQNLGFLTPDDPGEHSADLLSYLTPSPFHPIWQGQPPEWMTTVLDRERALEEGFNYMGLIALLLAGIGLWRRWRQTRLWLVLTALTALLALGPTLIVAGRDTGWPLPYQLLSELPFFAWSRTPGRLNMTAMLGLSVMATAGAAYLYNLWDRSLPANLLMIGLAGLIALEYLPLWPFPLDTRPTPAYYHQLMTMPLNGGILEMPVTGSRRASNYAMYYQTTHRQPLAGGYIERDPPGTVELKAFLNQLVSPIPDQTVLALPTATERRAALAALRIDQVIAHPDLMTDRAAQETLAYLPELLGPAAFTGDDLQVYPASPATSDLPPLLVLPDQDNWEVIHDGSAMRLRETGYLFLFANAPTCLALEFRIEPPAEPATLMARFNDIPIATPGPISTEPYRLEPLSLQAGLNYLHLDTQPAAELEIQAITAQPIAASNCPDEGAK
ncbi:MAG: hypothetical protein H6632_15485 [Anaerolineales bacterium]|nr:hypothetical protein [Anaerolineales bacterium]